MKDAVLKTDICIQCPGSNWGDSNFCSIHRMKIFEVSVCPEWDGKLYIDKGGQLTTHDPAQLMEIIQKTEEDIRDYNWMEREVRRLEREIDEAIMISGFSNSLTAQYGIEAAMPKGQGLKLSTMSVSEKQYERKLKRVEKLQEKINKIDRAVEKITDGRQLAVLECMLDRVPMNMIAQHVGVSRQTLNDIKREIITKLATEIYKDELQNSA